MGVEILNNFAEGLYCGSTGTYSEFQINDCAENEPSVVDRRNDVVKHTLKSQVMERLKKRGVDKITVDFTPKPSYPMTEEEIEKDRKRRESNRNSAQRCREKQKKEDKMNRNLLVHLKEERARLLHKVNESEEEKNKVLFKLKQILPDSYIQKALGKIKHATNKKEDPKSQMELPHSNEQDSTTREIIQVDNSYTSESLDPNDLIFTENCIFEVNCPDGEVFLSSLRTVSDNESHVNAVVDFLEEGNEETVQLFDRNFVSVENADVHSIIFKDY